MLASGGVGLAHTGDAERVVDDVGHAAGFHVRYVKLAGQRETSDSAILASVGIDPGASLLSVDVVAVRDRLEALPWVKRATVRKVLPGVLDVAIEEASAYARWRREGAEVLIAEDGTVLLDEVPGRFRDLPLVAGRRANETATQAVALLSAQAESGQPALAAVRVNGRRWDLKFASGATVRLPEHGAKSALRRLADLEEEGALLSAGPGVIDMRLAGRTTVALSPAPSDGGEALPDGLPDEDPLAAAIARADGVPEALDPLALAIAEAGL